MEDLCMQDTTPELINFDKYKHPQQGKLKRNCQNLLLHRPTQTSCNIWESYLKNWWYQHSQGTFYEWDKEVMLLMG